MIGSAVLVWNGLAKLNCIKLKLPHIAYDFAITLRRNIGEIDVGYRDRGKAEAQGPFFQARLARIDPQDALVDYAGIERRICT
jgi:hypothetical protein